MSTVKMTHTDPSDLPHFENGQIVHHPDHGRVTVTSVETGKLQSRTGRVSVPVKLTARNANGDTVTFPVANLNR